MHCNKTTNFRGTDRYTFRIHLIPFTKMHYTCIHGKKERSTYLMKKLLSLFLALSMLLGCMPALAEERAKAYNKQAALVSQYDAELVSGDAYLPENIIQTRFPAAN